MELEFRTCAVYDTKQSADSVEWCPHPEGADLFVCGTYQLESGDQTTGGSDRKGRVFLFRFPDDEDKCLTLLQTLERSAVLDQKWHRSQCDRLAVAGSDGSIQVYELADMETPRLESQVMCSLRDEESPVLALSLDWSREGDRMVVSDSDGTVNLLSYDSELKTINRWKAHGFEAWTAAFSRHNENVVYSGGDDSLLCVHDLRCPGVPVSKNKSHTAGVTSLLSFEHREHTLLTGNYDGKVRLFDERQMKADVTQADLVGGIWRLRPNPRCPEQIMCACMYENFSTIQLTADLGLAKTGVYDAHESICYGCDWQVVSPNRSPTSDTYVATCSFYDHKLCVSKVVELDR
ncbi:diphthine methyltransferase [Anopheles cruzii]|uniref:diphthine methyltransferase n=1 Tax=Anopheles cruzii TaxID=68878 RepID=UPI0022EC7EA7|nr:diphthine methyltransferase [Anopheles cruzii]